MDAKVDVVKRRMEGSVLTLTLNRPEVYNAFDRTMIAQLRDELLAAGRDAAVRVVVLTGEGKAFCSGADLKGALASNPDHPGEFFYATAAIFHQCLTEIRNAPKPVIAAVNGVAAGGGFGLALGCDMRVLAAGAMLKLGFVGNGLSADGGTTFLLPRLVGMARALQIAMLDEPIPAIKAFELGLATSIAPDGRALEEALRLAERLAAMPIATIGRVKKLMSRSFETSFERQLEDERDAIAASASSPEGREGLRAFVEKRKPRFQ